MEKKNKKKKKKKHLCLTAHEYVYTVPTYTSMYHVTARGYVAMQSCYVRRLFCGFYTCSGSERDDERSEDFFIKQIEPAS